MRVLENLIQAEAYRDGETVDDWLGAGDHDEWITGATLWVKWNSLDTNTAEIGVSLSSIVTLQNT